MNGIEWSVCGEAKSNVVRIKQYIFSSLSLSILLLKYVGCGGFDGECIEDASVTELYGREEKAAF